MLLYLSIFYIGVAPHFLHRLKFLQSTVLQILHSVLLSLEILDSQADDSIQLLPAPHFVLYGALIEIPYEILLQSPAPGTLVPHRPVCGNLGNQPVVLNGLKRELVGRLVVLAELLHEDELSRGNLIMDVPVPGLSLLLRVLRLENMPLGIRSRNDVEIESQ